MRTTLVARRLPLTLLLLFVGSLQVMAQTNWAIEKKLKIGGEGAWDYLTAMNLWNF